VGWAVVLMDALDTMKLFLLPETETLFLGHTDHSLATMPTELSRSPALPSFWAILQDKL